jgi:orotate phosphoribosyltransferase-like protein
MKKLVQEKEKAVELRRKGLSYKEILKQVPVAKSSLSLWLKDLPLTKDEKTVILATVALKQLQSFAIED